MTSALDHSAILPFYILNWKLYLISMNTLSNFLIFKLKNTILIRLIGWNQCQQEHQCVYRDQFILIFIGRTGNWTHYVAIDRLRLRPIAYPVVIWKNKDVLPNFVTFLIYPIRNSVKSFSEYLSVSTQEK